MEKETLFFDADYTTRAIADGIKPTREYTTIGQVQSDYLDPCEFQDIPLSEFEEGISGLALDYRDYENGHEVISPDKL
jgi:hypothetical protein